MLPAPRSATVEPGTILDEHRAIHAAVDALRAHIRRPAPAGRARWLKRLVEDLEALGGLLRPHFAREDATGMFERIEAALPESSHECARLRGQHGGLLDRLATLERKLQATRHDAKSVETVHGGIQTLLADLSAHEAAENALLLRAMEGEEVGALD